MEAPRFKESAGIFPRAPGIKVFWFFSSEKKCFLTFYLGSDVMPKFGQSQPFRRVEDPRLLTGAGRYTDDINLPGQLHAIVLRSPHAHAGITRIDTEAARAIPGVRLILTAAELAAENLGGMACTLPLANIDGTPRHASPRPVLADGVVHHVGDPVAFIVADTLHAARDASEAIEVDYDQRPAVADLRAATAPGAATVWPDAAGNVCFRWGIGDAAQTDALFAGAAHITKLPIVNNRIVVASMEPRAAIGAYDDGKYTLTSNTQGGWSLKSILTTQVFKIAPENLRIVTPDVGGGFGMKAFLYPEQVLVLVAAKKLGAPVKWMSTRSEAFLSDTHGRDNLAEAELALDANGMFLALRLHTYANMGAYLSMYGPFIPTVAASGVLAGVYGFQAIRSEVTGIYTHTVPIDAYRGAGRPESNYVVERLIDTAARELGIDPAELRRRNMVPPSSMPYTTPVGKIYDSGEFEKILDIALQKFDWTNFPARRAESEARGRKRGIGMSYYLEATGGGPVERAEIRFAPDGKVDVFVGTQTNGQGHETAYVMLTADRLGIAPENIRVIQGDTDTIPQGGGTGGARSLYSQGTAIYATAASIIEKGKMLAANILESTPENIAFADGYFNVTGTNRGIDILELAGKTRDGDGNSPLSTAEIAKIPFHTFPNGCHMVEVEIDPDTGSLQILRYLVVDDVGHAINPMIVRGQVHGGVAQGFGQAICERTSYDPETSQLLAGSFMDYALPRASDLPDFEVELVDVPCATNPLGVKGAGEAGTVGSPPAIMNAIVDALGGRAIDMPATPERVWEALQAA
jgi:carbon-monoxide dehydrogenase large subunit